MQDRRPQIIVVGLLLFGVGFGLGYLVRGGAPAAPPDASDAASGRGVDPEILASAEAGAASDGGVAVSASAGAGTAAEEGGASAAGEGSVAVVRGSGEAGASTATGSGSTAAGVPLPGPSDGGRPHGRLGASEIRSVVSEHREELGFCFAWQLHQHPELQGRITMGFTIGEHGRVTEAEVVDDALGDETVLRCFVNVTRRMEFPAPEGGEVSVRYPFDLSPGDEPSR